jgi:hypothetical protein
MENKSVAHVQLRGIMRILTREAKPARCVCVCVCVSKLIGTCKSFSLKKHKYFPTETRLADDGEASSRTPPEKIFSPDSGHFLYFSLCFTADAIKFLMFFYKIGAKINSPSLFFCIQNRYSFAQYRHNSKILQNSACNSVFFNNRTTGLFFVRLPGNKTGMFCIFPALHYLCALRI